MLANVRKDTAKIARVAQGIGGEDRHIPSGEEGDVKTAAGDVGGHPLGVFAAAESIVAQEPLGAWDAQTVEAAGPPEAAFGIEGGGQFGGLQLADLRDGEPNEVDGELGFRNGYVAGDGIGVRTGCTPVSFFLRCA